MSQTLSTKRTILNTTAADVAQGSATWYNVEGADKLIFKVAITGTLTVNLDFDLSGADDYVTQTATSSQTLVCDDPCVRVRAYTSGCSTGESASVQLYESLGEGR